MTSWRCPAFSSFVQGSLDAELSDDSARAGAFQPAPALFLPLLRGLRSTRAVLEASERCNKEVSFMRLY